MSDSIQALKTAMVAFFNDRRRGLETASQAADLLARFKRIGELQAAGKHDLFATLIEEFLRDLQHRSSQ